MTNQDDTFAELAAARAYITRGKTDGRYLDDALGCVEQAIKLVAAEFAALIADHAELEGLLIRQTVEAVNTRAGLYDHAAVEEAQQAADEAYQAATSTAHAGLAADIQKIMGPREMPVSWGYRYEAGMMDDGDWRSHA